MKRKTVIRAVMYLIGLLILAFGITLNTKTGLGVSPPVSVAYVTAEITGMNFGTMTFALYCVYTLLEMAVHLRTGQLRQRTGAAFQPGRILTADLLQIPLSLVFSWFVSLFSASLPELAEDCRGTFWGGLAGRVLALLLAIVCTGIGAALSLEMRLIPNPGDGVVQALSDFSGKSLGSTKNCFDAVSIGVSALIGLMAAGRIIGIGIGTVIAVLGVGRVIALWNRLFQKRIQKAAGIAR